MSDTDEDILRALLTDPVDFLMQLTPSPLRYRLVDTLQRKCRI